ncbi:HIRAN domain-containing protein [Cycloclasticus pugetii]|uniref:HIRAN domain-containing protein n=1 Tax=Cycloclasticus pugetii TaxID=34068 RepID=UPI003A8E2B5B
MKYSAIVAGTGFEGRADIIRRHVKPGMVINLKPEPENKYDPNAIAVHIKVRPWYLLFIPCEFQIGYLKKRLAATVSKKLREGGKAQASVKSMDTYLDHPRVSIEIMASW